jgi:lipid II:glycine glycyltransferase (peptidoglycan interpeptide bridge formation enzyme)
MSSPAAVHAVPGSEQSAAATIATEPTADWDELAVDRPGGHVYQSRAWAEHRRAIGWQPLFISVAGLRILALVRPWFLVDGGSAYIPRGPAPVVPGGELGSALWQTTVALARRGIDVIAEDAEVPADDAEWRTWLRRARYRPIDEIQPSRHRLTLPLSGRDEEAVFGGVAKSTRQRIRKAESAGIAVVRYDGRMGDGGGDSGFLAPAEGAETALDRFYDLLLETGERRDFSFGPRREFVTWWTRALAAGHLVFLEARDGGVEGEVLAGLVVHRHGHRLSTVHSGDHAASRAAHPGALHLLRWRAIQLAIAERATEMDLGGVDVAGARREPREGEPMHGLYRHKLSFGGRWMSLSGAHERVIRSNRYAAGRLLARARRALPMPE